VPTADQWHFAVTLMAALGCGLVAGVFFAFSTFVMKALARLPDGQGLAAMQSVNVVVLRSSFIAVFLGSAAACLLALVFSLSRWPAPVAVWRVLGSVLYLVGSLLVTFVFNVPRNDALVSVAPSDPDLTRRWSGYVVGWTAWNHVRTIASLAAAGAFSMALSY